MDLPIIAELTKPLTRIFTGKEFAKGVENPLAFFELGEEGTELMNFITSYFGTRIISILQHNPYDVMDKMDIASPNINKLGEEIIKIWESDGSFLNMTKKERQMLTLQTKITGYHIANFCKWISIIDAELLKSFLPLKQLDGTTVSNDHYDKDKFADWEKDYCVAESDRPGFDGQFIFESPSLKKFKSFKDMKKLKIGLLKKALKKMGIWNDDVLRSLPPMYLNTYLPITLMGLVKADDEESKSFKNFTLIKKSFFPSDAESEGLNHLPEIWHKNLMKQKKFAKYCQDLLEKHNLKMDVGVELVTENDNSEPKSVIRLLPALTRYLSAIRDVPSPNAERMLPVKSPSANLARYLLPDVPGGVVKNSLPNFIKAADKMKHLRFAGLLPDEDSLDWSVLLRIVLLSNSDFATIKQRLKESSRIQNLTLDTFSNEIESILNHIYSDEMISTPKSSDSICLQASILRNRILGSIDLANSLLENLPTEWYREKYAIDHWIKVVKDIFDEEIKDKGNDFPNYIPATLRNMMFLIKKEISKGIWSKNKNNKNTDEKSNRIAKVPIQNINRLLYDIVSNLGESLLQAEYMGSKDQTSRVHFSMTGFSDKLIGKPSGILSLVHSSSSKKEGSTDAETDAVRTSIEDCIGLIPNSKEFFFQHHFGPKCVVTIAMQQAPSGEISSRFVKLMKSFLGNDRYHYTTKAKLHPYAFLYNVIWMSANVHRWTSSSNLEYMRKFIIPTKVIAYHFSDPQRIASMVDEVSQTYANTGVDFPTSDVQILGNVLKKDARPHRNIVDIIGTMAIRHMARRGDENEFGAENYSDEWVEAGLDKTQFMEMWEKYFVNARKVRPECLELESSDDDDDEDDEGGMDFDDDPADDFDMEFPDFDDDYDENTDEWIDGNSVKDRCIGWFKAYKNWVDLRDQSSESLDHRTDSVSTWNATSDE